MTSSEFSKSLIALACWRAAKSDLHSVMLAVALVFLNRARASWYGGDVYENVTRWLAENPGEFPDTRDPQFQQLLAKIDAVLAGMYPDRTDGALWFVSKTDLPEKIEGTVTTTIGNLTFVR